MRKYSLDIKCGSGNAVNVNSFFFSSTVYDPYFIDSYLAMSHDWPGVGF